MNFTVTEGSVSATTAITDADGKASVIWTLGTMAGEQILTITALKADGAALTGSPISVTATVILPITVTDFDDNTYSTVTIGPQTWMAENLKTTHYANGDAIPTVTDSDLDGSTLDEWLGLNYNDKAYCYYNDNENSEKGYLWSLIHLYRRN